MRRGCSIPYNDCSRRGFRVADANGAGLAEAELGQVVTVMQHRGRRRYQWRSNNFAR